LQFPEPNHRLGKGGWVCSKHLMERWRANNPIRNAYTQIRSSAGKRKIPFLITFKEFKRFIEDSDYLQQSGRDPNDSTIDRIDAEKGYQVGNLRVISNGENVWKWNAYDKLVREGKLKGVTYEEFCEQNKPDTEYDGPTRGEDPF